MAHGLDAVRWDAPWLAPWRVLGEPAAQRILAGHGTLEVLNAAARQQFPAGVPVQFVAPVALPPGGAYEQFVAEHGRCPTREGLHDFFNALAWLRCPRTKQRLNRLHMAQITQAGVAPTRGALRDALTLFDENGALLRAPDALWDALVRKNWAQLFGPLRPLWAQARLVLFGHALLEKLVQPRKPITAHVLRDRSESDDLIALDDWLDAHLSAEGLARKPFAHLPVLGVPGWWPANEHPAFYADASVFRVPRPCGGSK